MGHHICAIIGKKPVNEEAIRKYQLAAAFEGDYVIVILDQDSVWHWSEKLQLSSDSESEHIDFACELIFHFAKEIGFHKYGIIQTDYFGGVGSQCASLYEEGRVLIAEKMIDDILRELGVVRTKEKDEFDILNLGEYRSGDYYYWESLPENVKRPNVIYGRIPQNG